MIPFVFGLFFVVPVNVYYDAVFHGYFGGDFLHFYLGPYFIEFFPFSMNFSPTYFADSNQGVYLWYLFWLFVFSFITVHFFKWLAKAGNRDRFSKLHAVCTKRGGILLLAIPLIV
jgi:glucan biosynthesis protein C